MIGVVLATLTWMMSDTLVIEPLKIPITARDNENHGLTLYLGFHPSATYGFDQILGEMPIPPVPAVQAFDVRFLDPLLRKQFPGDGGYVDIRKCVSRTQADTFFIRAQPANDSFPVTFSWPDGLEAYFDTMLLKYHQKGSVHMIDMTKQTTFELTGSEPASFMIVISGLKGNLSWKD